MISRRMPKLFTFKTGIKLHMTELFKRVSCHSAFELKDDCLLQFRQIILEN